MRVLHITDRFSHRLAEKVACLARMQNALGIEANVIFNENRKTSALQNSSALDLLHVHSPFSLPLAIPLKHRSGAPLIVTCERSPAPELVPLFKEVSVILCSSEHSAGNLSQFIRKIHFLQYGVDLDAFQPGGKKEPVKIALVNLTTKETNNAIYHFCKAVDLLEGVKFIIVSNQNPGSATAKFRPWTEKLQSLLAGTDIVASAGPILLEGLACGNAAYILGKNCQGILTPEAYSQNKIPDFSGLSGASPCYRNIFYDLAALTYNKTYLRQLQSFGRELAEKEYCLKKTAAILIEIYKSIL